jgi:epoxide hydrolase-like predicted phosphatase
MSIQAVIFDLGGVLVRTEDYASRDALAGRLNLSRAELEEIVFAGESGDRAQLGELSEEEHWEAIRRQLGLPDTEMQAVRDGFWGGDVLDWKLIDFIRSLRPHYKTCLLSNAFSTLRHFVTNVWEFDDAFDAMIISSEVGLMKPDARIYRLAVDALGVQPEQAVFIDDMPPNISGAQAAGLHAIHFQSPEQVYRNLNALLDGRLA